MSPARPAGFPSFTLLLVEDDPGDAGLIQAYLRQAFPQGDSAGNTLPGVTRCETLAEAHIALADSPDIVLLDLHLPDSTGLATFSSLISARPDLAIIVLTGLDDFELSQLAMASGAQDYLVKSDIDANGLRRAITHARARSALRAELAAARDGLERAVAERTEELKRRIGELEEAQVALRVILEQRERDRRDSAERLSNDLRQQILPFLKKLARSRLDLGQRQLIDAIDAGLSQLMRDDRRLDSIFRQLTPTEIQVASLVRQGHSSKEIAEALCVSPETVSIHRKHIRAKLGLQRRGSNLRGYLMSLSD